MTDLRAGWARATLDEVAAWGSGGTPARSNTSFYGGPIPWAVIGDLTDGPVTETADSITTDGLKSSSAKIIQSDAVLVAMYGASIGRLGLPTREMASNQAIAFAVPRAEVLDRKFLFWFLKAAKPDLIAAGRGGAQPNISQTVLKDWQIDLPPLEEQHRIVEALEDHFSRLDAADVMLSACVRRTRALAASSIDYSATVAADSCEGASPPPAADVNDGELPQLPASWRWSRLGEIADVVGGITKDSKKQSDESLALHPYLRVANVQAGYLDLGHITEIRATPAQVKKLTLQVGDVLLNEGGDRDKLGRGWVWEDQVPDCLHQNHVFRARVLDDAIDPRLIAWHANSFGRAWFIANGKQSVNLASVSLTTVRAFPVPVPPRELQSGIVERIRGDLSSFDRLLDGIGAAQSRCAVVRRSILRAAFNGELVDQDPSDEPATVALERLRAAPKPVRKRAAKSSASAATRS